MNQVKAGAVLNYVIIALNTLLGLCYTPYMLHKLGQNEYGLYSLVASIIAYLTLLDFGFGATVIRYTARYRAQNDHESQYSLFGLFFVMYSIIGLIAFACGLLLLFNVDALFDRTMTADDIHQTRVMILLLLVNLAITFPMSIFGAIISAYERFVFQKIMIICRTVFSTLTIVLLLYVGYKAVAMVVVQTVFNILLLLSNFVFCKRKLNIKLKFKKFEWGFIRELLGFSVWVFLGDLMFKFYYNTGQFVLGATSGTVAISIFALGITLMQMYIMFSGGISGVLLPKMTTMVTRQASDHEIAQVFLKVGRIQFFIISLVLSGFVIFGKSFITLWAGQGYIEDYTICLIFFFTTVIPLIQNTGIVILQARNQQKFRALMLLIVSAVSLLLQIVLSKYYGAVGCAIAVGAANFVGQGVILNIYYSRKQHLEIRSFWQSIFRMSIYPVLITILGVYLHQFIDLSNFYRLGIWIIIYSILFIALGWKFSLNVNERKMLGSPFIRLKNRILHG